MTGGTLEDSSSMVCTNQPDCILRFRDQVSYQVRVRVRVRIRVQVTPASLQTMIFILKLTIRNLPLGAQSPGLRFMVQSWADLASPRTETVLHTFLLSTASAASPRRPRLISPLAPPSSQHLCLAVGDILDHGGVEERSFADGISAELLEAFADRLPERSQTLPHLSEGSHVAGRATCEGAWKVRFRVRGRTQV